MSTLPPPGTKYAVYARSAAALQGVGSCDDQVAACRDYARRHEWQDAGVFVDAGCSGRHVGRDGYFSMMSAARRAEFDVVLVEGLDRLSRMASAARLIVEELEALGIVVCTVGSGVVSTMGLGFRCSMSSQSTHEPPAKGRAHEVAPGAEIRIPPEQAAIVRRIFETYAAGKSMLEICADLYPDDGGSQ